MLPDIVEKRLQNIEGLPTLPIVLRQIQIVMNNERTSMAQIAAVVAKDQALTSRAIRLVNSAWYGRSTRVTSIQQVLVTIGLKTLHTLMLGLTVTKMFSTSSRTDGFDSLSFWKHAFGTALIAKKLGQKTSGKVDGETCFVAGLLHDLGRLVLEQFFHEEFVKALELSKSRHQSLLTAENNIFGFNHADTGLWLGKKWNLSNDLLNAIGYHHHATFPSYLQPKETAFIGIIADANFLSLSEGIGASGEYVRDVPESGFHCSLTSDLRNRILKETRSEVDHTIREWSS